MKRFLPPRFLAFILCAFLAAACGDDGSSVVASEPSADEASADEASADEASADEPTPPPAAPAEPADPTAAPAPTASPDPTAPPAPTAVASPVASEPEFYDAPGELQVPLPLPNGAPGTVIDTEPISMNGAVAQRILYHSTSTLGDNIAVSGFVAYPDGEPPEGGWPLIAWAHGTTGLGDACAPSHDAENDQVAITLVNFGYAVVATDYEGLGTPGLHPYVVGTSEAHSVLDSVRAVYQLGLPVTDQWVVFGHSQGGHAAMFTGQLQPTYAPEIDLIGVVAGAPPSQMSEVGDSLIGGDFQGYLVMTAAGMTAADPSLDLAEVLSPSTLATIDVLETGCTAEIFEIYNPQPYDDVASSNDPFALPNWSAALSANDTNQLPVTMPLLIIHGGEDEQIPVETSATLFEQLCAFEDQGPTIRNVYEGQTHAGVLSTFAAVPDLTSWVQGLFAGEPAEDRCG